MKVMVSNESSEFYEPKFREPNFGPVTISDDMIGDVNEDELKDAILQDGVLDYVTVTFSLGLTGRMKLEDVPVEKVVPIENEGLWLRATVQKGD